MKLENLVTSLLIPASERISRRKISRYEQVALQINSLEQSYSELTDEELANKTLEFRERLNTKKDTLETLLPEAYAAVRESSKRTLSLRHHDVQLIAGITMNNRSIVEQRTGEGKTLTATLPLYLNALEGKGAHLVTANDYLARRDARWMAPIFHKLGMSVGVLQNVAAVENSKMGFLVDFTSNTNGEESTQNLRLVTRQESYQADITYGASSEFGFDYLRDSMVYKITDKVQRGHHFAVIDEVDNVLIDEARTPLELSSPSQEKHEESCRIFSKAVKELRTGDYEINEKDQTISLTDIGLAHVEQLTGLQLLDPLRPEQVTSEQALNWGFLQQSLRAHHLYKRNVHYIVTNGEIVITNEFTGRPMPGRRWGDGLHQAVEAKENLEIRPDNITFATITVQNYYRMYDKLAGMTGTALSSAEEFYKIYGLSVVPVPSHVEYLASSSNPTHRKVTKKDNDGLLHTIYLPNATSKDQTIYHERLDLPEVNYDSPESKIRGITTDIITRHVTGQPILTGTTSVEKSYQMSLRLGQEGIQKLLWCKLLANHQDLPLEELSLRELELEAQKLGLAPDLLDESNLARLYTLLNIKQVGKLNFQKIITSGVPHQVLNAENHAKEALIIAGAGQLYAVTIATNMAGRGVDIKLGGEDQAEAMEVRKLGGLHIIGSEKHVSKRIDNQLRGRAARQGDPGSSQFHSSVVDDIPNMQVQSKTEVEDAASRESLLEYDDVVNHQRIAIFNERDFYLELPTLTTQYSRMLDLTIAENIANIDQASGRLMFLTWIDQVQSARANKSENTRSFTENMLLERVQTAMEEGRPKEAIVLDITTNLIQADIRHKQEFLRKTLSNTEDILEKAISHHEQMVKEYLESSSKEGGFSNPQEILDNVQGMLNLTFSIESKTLEKLPKSRKGLEKLIQKSIRNSLISIAINQTHKAFITAIPGFTPITSRMIVNNWEEYSRHISQTFNTFIFENHKRLLGENGLVIQKLHGTKQLNQLDQEGILNFILSLQTTTSKTRIGKRTIITQSNNFDKNHFLSEEIGSIPIPVLASRAKQHILRAKNHMITRAGEKAYVKLSKRAKFVSELGEAAKQALGDDYREWRLISGLTRSEIMLIKEFLGKEEITQRHKQLIAGTISSYWTDYLNRSIATRTSVRLEAYARRDPLVKYKSESAENFSILKNAIRASFINHSFDRPFRH